MIWHVIPDEEGHKRDSKCKCCPEAKVIGDAGDMIITHNILSEVLIEDILGSMNFEDLK